MSCLNADHSCSLGRVGLLFFWSRRRAYKFPILRRSCDPRSSRLDSLGIFSHFQAINRFCFVSVQLHSSLQTLLLIRRNFTRCSCRTFRWPDPRSACTLPAHCRVSRWRSSGMSVCFLYSAHQIICRAPVTPCFLSLCWDLRLNLVSYRFRVPFRWIRALRTGCSSD